MPVAVIWTLIAAIPSYSAESAGLVAPGATIQKTTGFTATEGPATDADGNVWFTEVFASRIRKWTWKDGKTTLYRENTGPNGLIGTPDGKKLYVGDGAKVFSYRINSDGSLSDKTLFCESRTDGMAMDEHDNVYLTDDKDILIYSPEGELVEKIETPDGTSNVEFCGKDRRTLFFTYHENIYTLEMNVRGGKLPIDSLIK